MKVQLVNSLVDCWEVFVSLQSSSTSYPACMYIYGSVFLMTRSVAIVSSIPQAVFPSLRPGLEASI